MAPQESLILERLREEKALNTGLLNLYTREGARGDTILNPLQGIWGGVQSGEYNDWTNRK